MNKNFYTGLGAFLIIVGALGAVGIIFSFDWETWNRAKEYESLYADDIIMLKPLLTNTWVTAITTFLGSLAVGSVLMALGKIVDVLEDNNEYLKMIYQIEKQNKASE